MDKNVYGQKDYYPIAITMLIAKVMNSEHFSKKNVSAFLFLQYALEVVLRTKLFMEKSVSPDCYTLAYCSGNEQ